MIIRDKCMIYRKTKLNLRLLAIIEIKEFILLVVSITIRKREKKLNQ